MSSHRDDNTFVSTKSVKKGMEIIEKYGRVIYTGLAGDGKTTIGVEILNRYQKRNPEWVFLKMNAIEKWEDVNSHVNTVILFDDCLGKTHANMGVINEGHKYWPSIYDSSNPKYGKVKVIFTIRKHIFDSNQTKFERYSLFSNVHIVDLTSVDYRLTYNDKTEILQRHFENNGLVIEVDEDGRIKSAHDDEVGVKLDFGDIDRIINSKPIIGFPLSCFLFCNNKTYTKQGYNFFQRPSQFLVDEIKEMKNFESKPFDKLQYCIMCYMMLKEGSIDLNDVDKGLLRTVHESVNLKLEFPINSQIEEATYILKHRYIIKENEKYCFIHRTVLESIALCFFVDNAELVLKHCREELLEEFIRPSEGENVLVLTEKNYKHLIPRFIKVLLDGSERWSRDYTWWVAHPVMDDVKFIDSFMGVVVSNEEYITAVQVHFRTIFTDAVKNNKTHFLDRLYKVFPVQCFNNMDNGDILGSTYKYITVHTDAVTWLLEHRICLKSVLKAMSNVPVDTLTFIVKHPAVTLDNVKQAWSEIYLKFDSKITETLLRRWPNIERTYVTDILCGVCLSINNYKTVEVIIKHRPDVVTKEIMQRAFMWACCNENTDVVEYLLSLNLEEKLYSTSNDDNFTPLHVAAYFGNNGIFTKLIELGTLATERTTSRYSVLQLAIFGYIHNANTSGPESIASIFGYIYKAKTYGPESIASLFSTNLKCDVRTLQKQRGNKNRYFLRLFTHLLSCKSIEFSDLDMKVDSNGCTLVHLCAMFNDVELLELLNQANSDTIFSKNNEDMTCLHIAAFFGCYSVVKKLVEFGLKVTQKTKSNFSVLQMAISGYAFKNSLDNFSFELDLVPNELMETIYTLQGYMFSRQLRSDSTSILHYLLKQQGCVKEDLDMVIDKSGDTLVHLAVVCKDVDLIDMLYETNRQSIFLKNDDKMTCAHVAAILGDYDILVKLIGMGLSVRDRTDTFFLTANVMKMAIIGYIAWVHDEMGTDSRFGYIEDTSGVSAEMLRILSDSRFYSSSVLRYLLYHKECNEDDFDLRVDDYGCTITHYCVLVNDTKLLALLHERNERFILEKNDEEMTCGHVAAFFGRYNMLVKLIEMGLSATDRTKSNLSVLQMSVLGYLFARHDIVSDTTTKELIGPFLKPFIDSGFDSGNYEAVIRYILQHKVCVEDDLSLVIDEFRNTLAHYCVMFPDKVLAILYEKSCKFVFTESKHTGIHIDALLGRHNRLAKCENMLECSTTEIPKEYFSVLQMTIIGYIVRGVKFDDVSAFTARTSAGSLIQYLNSRRRLFGSYNDLDYARSFRCIFQHKGCVKNEINLAVDNFGGTLAHYCTFLRDIQLLVLLHVENKECILTPNDEKMTCLHIAAFFGNGDIFVKLLEMGLPVTDRTKLNVSVLQMAIFGYMKRRVGVHCLVDFAQTSIRSLTNYLNHRKHLFEYNDKQDYTRIFRCIFHQKGCVKNEINLAVDNYGGTLAHYCTFLGDIQLLVLLQEQNKETILTPNIEKMTCLHIAAFVGNTDILVKLLEMSLPVTNIPKSNVSVLQMAIFGYIVKRIGVNYVLDIAKASIQSLMHYHKLWSYKESRFTFGSVLQHIEFDTHDLDMVVDDCGCTLAHYCVMFNDAELLTHLYKQNSKIILAQTNDKMNSAHIAAFFGRYDMLVKLIEMGLSVTYTTKSDASVLQMGILGYVLKHLGMNNVTDTAKEKIGPLVHYHLKANDSSMKSDYANMFGYILSHKECVREDLDMVVDVHGGRLAHYCVILDDVNLLVLLHERRSGSIFRENSENMTCSHIAAFLDRYDILVKLVEMGLSVRDNTKANVSVLQMAILGYILKHMGINNMIDTAHGMIGSLLHYHLNDEKINEKPDLFDYWSKYKSGYTNVFRCLLEHKECVGEDLDMVVDIYGGRLAHYWIILDDVQLLLLLHDIRNESLFKKNNDNMTCAHIAAFLGSYTIFVKLVEFGLSVTEKTKSNATVLQMTILGYIMMGEGEDQKGLYFYHESDTNVINVDDNATDADILDEMDVGNVNLDVDQMNQYYTNGNDEEVGTLNVHKIPIILPVYYANNASKLKIIGNHNKYTNLLKYLIYHQDSVKDDLNLRIAYCNCTLCHYCVVYNNYEIIELLCESSKSVLCLENNNKHKPIHLAALLGRRKIFEILLVIDTDTDISKLQSLISEGRQIRIISDTRLIWKRHLAFIPYKMFVTLILTDEVTDRDYKKIESKLSENRLK